MDFTPDLLAQLEARAEAAAHYTKEEAIALLQRAGLLTSKAANKPTRPDINPENTKDRPRLDIPKS